MKPTLQEIQLVQFLAQGLSAKQIAGVLTPARSRRTVEKYISDMLDKFDAKNSPHLVAMFLDNGWIQKQTAPRAPEPAFTLEGLRLSTKQLEQLQFGRIWKTDN
jgi:DNA-binding CsgD family transcriptional regulator